MLQLQVENLQGFSKPPHVEILDESSVRSFPVPMPRSGQCWQTINNIQSGIVTIDSGDGSTYGLSVSRKEVAVDANHPLTLDHRTIFQKLSRQGKRITIINI